MTVPCPSVKPFLLLLALLYFLPHSIAAVVPLSKQTQQQIEKGLALAKQGKWKESIEVLKGAVEADPDSAEARYSLGVSWFWVKQFTAAKEQLGHALGLEPDLAPAHYFLGLCLEEEGDFEGAIDHLRNSIQHGAEPSQAYHRLGLVLGRVGDFAGSIRILRKAVDSRPEFSLARNDLGVAFLNAGNPQSAISEFQKLLSHDADDLTAKQNLALAFQRVGEPSAAETVYREIVELQAQDASAILNLGLTLMEQDKLQESGVEFRRAIRIAPGFSKAHYNLALTLWRRGELGEAEEVLRQATRLAPEDTGSAILNLGLTLMEQDKLQESGVSLCTGVGTQGDRGPGGGDPDPERMRPTSASVPGGTLFSGPAAPTWGRSRGGSRGDQDSRASAAKEDRCRKSRVCYLRWNTKAGRRRPGRSRGPPGGIYLRVSRFRSCPLSALSRLGENGASGRGSKSPRQSRDTRPRSASLTICPGTPRMGPR